MMIEKNRYFDLAGLIEVLDTRNNGEYLIVRWKYTTSHLVYEFNEVDFYKHFRVVKYKIGDRFKTHLVEVGNEVLVEVIRLEASGYGVKSILESNSKSYLIPYQEQDNIGKVQKC